MVPAVFVADADAELCDLYHQFFSHFGWLVQTSEGGLGCLAQLRQSPPHFLILDTHLPWGGADGLLAVMRDDPGLAHVSVVLTFTDLSPGAYSGLVSSPVVRALEKPFSLTALLEMLRSGLGQGSTLGLCS